MAWANSARLTCPSPSASQSTRNCSHQDAWPSAITVAAGLPVMCSCSQTRAPFGRQVISCDDAVRVGIQDRENRVDVAHAQVRAIHADISLAARARRALGRRRDTIIAR
jgi:hypothetical protein